VEAFERLANLATRAGVEAAGRGERWIRVRTPLLSMSKADIVRRGRELGVPLDRTVSCYDPGPDGAPCGRCDACQLRERGFREAG
jgi:7-cyano-7-deazaguanine synthase